jgi:hypothetical protein
MRSASRAISKDAFPYFMAVDWNVSPGLETKCHPPALNAENRHFDELPKFCGAAYYDCFMVLPA